MPNTIKKGKDEYYLSNTYKVGNVTCNVYRPILTDYERHLREEMVKDALASFGRSLYDLGLGHLLEGDEV